jgi:hypothetical protein
VVLRATGGRRQLCELVDEYGDELRGDFQEFYQLDLVDAWRGTLTARRVIDLAERLIDIPRSRFRAAVMHDERILGWGTEAEILADLYDALVDNSVITWKSAGGKASAGQRYPRPKPQLVEQAKTIADFPIREMVQMTS